MKKLSILLLTLALLFTLVPLPAAAATDLPDAWAQTEIQAAVDNGLVPSDFLHSYKADITRQQFCRLAILLVERLSGDTAANVISAQGLVLPSASPFADVSDESVTKAWVLGIVNGVGDGKFMPDRSITRQEAARMLESAAFAMGRFPAATGDAAAFTDSATIAAWARDSVGFVSGLGVMKGTSGGAFSPLKGYQRQMAYMTMNRLYTALQSETDTLASRVNPTTFLNYQLGNAESLQFSYVTESEGTSIPATSCAIEGGRIAIRFPGITMNDTYVDVFELITETSVIYAVPSTGKAATYPTPVSDVLLFELMSVTETAATAGRIENGALVYEYSLPFYQDESLDVVYRLVMQDGVLTEASSTLNGFTVSWLFSEFSTDAIPEATFELPAGLTMTTFDYPYDGSSVPFWYE